MAQDPRAHVQDTIGALSALSTQLATLVDHWVVPTMRDAGVRTESALKSTRGLMREQQALATSQVRGRPLLSVLLAAGIGFMVGRATR